MWKLLVAMRSHAGLGNGNRGYRPRLCFVAFVTPQTALRRKLLVAMRSHAGLGNGSGRGYRLRTILCYSVAGARERGRITERGKEDNPLTAKCFKPRVSLDTTS